jgi:pentatricopeptide repeat protein
VLELLQTGKFDLRYLDNASQEALQTLMEKDLQRADATMVEAIGYGNSLNPFAFQAPDCAIASFICRKYVEEGKQSVSREDHSTWRLVMDALVAVATRTGLTALTGQSMIDFNRSFIDFTATLSSLPERYRPSVDEIRPYAMLVLARTGDPDIIPVLSQCVKPRDKAFLEQKLQEAIATPELSEGVTAEASELQTPPLAPPFIIDSHLSATINGHCLSRPTITPFSAYELVKSKLKQGKAPKADVLARLLQSISRSGEEVKVQDLYEIAHQALALVPEEERFAGFVYIEDNMMIAQLHLGHTDKAMHHRDVIFQTGGVPSADAYATMISFAKDSTDDANVAREMFAESERQGVKPNLYLFNTIISKLSKARKAESAIELFKRMKVENILPSSVTYGAVIVSFHGASSHSVRLLMSSNPRQNACCRVGDATSAATLFNEMQSMRGFKPRVPPYK